MSAIVASNLNKTPLSSVIFGCTNSEIKFFQAVAFVLAFHAGDLWPSHSEKLKYRVAHVHYSALDNAL